MLRSLYFVFQGFVVDDVFVLEYFMSLFFRFILIFNLRIIFKFTMTRSMGVCQPPGGHRLKLEPFMSH